MQGLLSSIALALSLVVPLLLLGGLGRRILLKLVEYIKRNLDGSNKIKIMGTVVLMKKNVLSFNDFHAAVIDRIDELLGEMVSFELVSATVGDPNKGNRGKVGHLAYLGGWLRSMPALTAGESTFHLTFYWDEGYGVPGAVIVKNHHHNEFLLKSLTLEGVPGEKRVHFDCNSWVYPVSKYKYDRIFFTNKTYVPCETPEPLQQYREEELLHLRGEGVTGTLQIHDRVYDYAYYNDLGEPDKGLDYVRPVLGGSADYPYPRRGRTGRPPTMNDPKTESRLSLLNLDIYVPRDERFGHLKMADFLGYAIKSLNQSLLPILKGALKNSSMEFKTFQDILDLYEGGLPLPDCPELNEIKNRIPLEMIKELVRTDGERLLRFPLPQIIQEDKLAWRTDEEFTREMLAGVNPLVIRRLENFSFSSNHHPKKQHGLTLNKVMSITEEHIKKKQDGLMLKKANKESRLFVVDYYDALMPYLNRINSGSNKIYASRTLLYLEDDGTLKPLAIELSRPDPDGEEHGSVSQIFTPSEHGVEGSMWQLAKAYATVNDSGYHQLVSHWLNTHAVMEPFVIATNRQLSVVHPIYKLLSPHYRDTMNINALARQTLINAGGILELTVFPGRYAMEMSSTIYKDWKFTEQGLPDDLIKRGVAVEDPPGSKNIRLLIRDYPYAVDGLAIWSAIERWVTKYISIYYKDQAAVQSDVELQAWWKEIREVGHGDKKDEDWWPKMQTRDELIKICTTIIWVGSALHAAVNFGQYSYAGYMPNRPTISRRFMPEPDTAEYEELKTNPDGVFLKTITSQLQTILGVSLIEILSRHASDEVYLGQRASPEWTTDEKALDAFKQFGEDLTEIEKQINERNRDKSLKNRNGPARVDYTLLYPNTSDLTHIGGLTGKGIPNSVSI